MMIKPISKRKKEITIQRYLKKRKREVFLQERIRNNSNNNTFQKMMKKRTSITEIEGTNNNNNNNYNINNNSNSNSNNRLSEDKVYRLTDMDQTRRFKHHSSLPEDKVIDNLATHLNSKYFPLNPSQWPSVKNHILCHSRTNNNSFKEIYRLLVDLLITPQQMSREALLNSFSIKMHHSDKWLL